MKKIVIVEDKPWVTSDAVQSLQKDKAEVIRIVYYPNTFGDDEEKSKLLQGLKEKTNVQIDRVNNQEEFVEKMEELYGEENVVFFMDYDLKGDSTMDPDSRINIRYAKHKEYREKVEEKGRKIWFYTVSGAANVEIIKRNFPDHVLGIENYIDGQLTWDANELNQILG